MTCWPRTVRSAEAGSPPRLATTPVGIYQNVLFPRLCNLVMRNHRFTPYRQRVIGAAQGRVLEIGAGSGLNFPYYGPCVREIIALEPSPRLIGMAGQNCRVKDLPVTFLAASAEAIPLDSRSIDTVVMTWTLCSIPDVTAALSEMRRVLNPNGRLLFVEHGAAPDARLRRWQDRLSPAWQTLSGGCHLNRATRELLEANGFLIEQLATGYMGAPKLLTFMSEGHAQVR